MTGGGVCIVGGGPGGKGGGGGIGVVGGCALGTGGGCRKGTSGTGGSFGGVRCSGLGARGDVLICVGNSRRGNCNCFGGGFGCDGGKFDLGNASSGGDFDQTSAGGAFYNFFRW